MLEDLIAAAFQRRSSERQRGSPQTHDGSNRRHAIAAGDGFLSAAPLLEQLIEALRCLPGVGQKSAQRMAYHLLERDREGGRRLGECLAEAMEKVGHCARCRDFSQTELCAICASPTRDIALLCAVESPADRFAIEQATGYRGLYFVLQGRLSPLDGIGPRELGLERLAARMAEGAHRCAS